MDERRKLSRSFKVELEETEGRMVEGCVVPYGEPAQVVDDEGTLPYWEVFEPGAFGKQLRAANRVELDYEHRDDLGSSIGICRSLREEASGLFGAFKIHAGAFGDQALELVREGILPGFSVLFSDRYRVWQRSAEGTVLRRSCELHKVSLCRAPAYASALVTATRSRREFELPEIDDGQIERLRAIGVEL